MLRKVYKIILFVCLSVLLVCLSFLFAACGGSKNADLNPSNTVDLNPSNADIFQEIKIYIQNNGKPGTISHFNGQKDEVYSLKHSNNENSFDYYPKRDILSIYGYTASLGGIYFTVYIPNLTSYASNNYFVDGAMSQFYYYQLTLPNTPRNYKESNHSQEGHRTIHQYEQYSYTEEKKSEVSSALGKLITDNLKAFSSYFQDKTSLSKIENALLYYFQLPLSISIEIT